MNGIGIHYKFNIDFTYRLILLTCHVPISLSLNNNFFTMVEQYKGAYVHLRILKYTPLFDLKSVSSPFFNPIHVGMFSLDCLSEGGGGVGFNFVMDSFSLLHSFFSYSSRYFFFFPLFSKYDKKRKEKKNPLLSIQSIRFSFYICRIILSFH